MILMTAPGSNMASCRFELPKLRNTSITANYYKYYKYRYMSYGTQVRAPETCILEYAAGANEELDNTNQPVSTEYR